MYLSKMTRNSETENRKGAARIAAIVLSIMLALSVIPWMGSAALADNGSGEESEIIKAVDLTLKIPECGDIAEKDGGSVAPEFTIPEGTGYESGGSGFWYGGGIGQKKDDEKAEDITEGQSQNKTDGDKFEGGKSYYACAYLKAKEGYGFDLDTSSKKAMFKGTVTLNGETVTPKLTKYYPDNGQILVVVVTVAVDHKYGEPNVEKAPTTLRSGSAKYTCAGCGLVKTEEIPPVAPSRRGADGTIYGKGADGKMAENGILALKSNKDPKGTQMRPLLLEGKKTGNNYVELSWARAKGAVRYRVYGAVSGNSNRMQYLDETDALTFKVTKIPDKLKGKTYYKFMILALDKNDKVVTTSKMIHAATAGSKKVSNYKGITVKKSRLRWGWYRTWKKISSIKIKKGKTQKLKVQQVKKYKHGKVKNITALRIESSNPKIATATKGKVKAHKKGKCTIYYYTQNGMCKKLTVKVK